MEDFYPRKFDADLEDDRESGTMNPAMRESEVVSSEECVGLAGSPQLEGKPLVLLQVNCTSILNKFLDFWNLVDPYNMDVIIGIERKLTMMKYLGTITQPLGETGVLEGVECSFVLKTTSIAGRYGRIRILR